MTLKQKLRFIIRSIVNINTTFVLESILNGHPVLFANCQSLRSFQSPLQVCGKEPYIVERIVAEKSWWCKNCFRCQQCNKLLNLDTYVSHEGVIYCKPHHKELFQPKVVKEDLVDMKKDKGRNKAGG